jgi:hypothetical protein
MHKGKKNGVPVKAMKAYRGRKGIAPLILNFGTTGKWEPRYPLYRRMGRLQSRSGCFGEDSNILPLSGFEPRIVQPVV